MTSENGSCSPIAKLKVTIANAVPTEDHATVRYVLQIEFGTLFWQISKRFSEVVALNEELLASGYIGLPPLPPKTLLSRPTDPDDVNPRREGLRQYMARLLARPDTRTSEELLAFLAVGPNADVRVEPVRAMEGCCLEDGRFAVGSVQFTVLSCGDVVMFFGQEDNTHLARLGRMWSVIESDELGSLQCWRWDSGGDKSKGICSSDSSAWSRLHLENFATKVRGIAYEEGTRQLFVGFDDGKVMSYNFNESEGTLKQTWESQLHSDCIMHMDCSATNLLTVGLDSCLRLLGVSDRSVRSGGRLAKRLGSQHLTVCLLDQHADRAILGTSGTDVFIYDVALNPPVLLHILQVSPNGPVTALCLTDRRAMVSSTAGCLFVAHGDAVTCFGLESKTHEKRTPRLSQFHSPLTSGRSIRDLTCCPETRRMMCASEGGVVVWSLATGTCVSAFKAHETGVRRITPLPAREKEGDPEWGTVTAGDDGKIKFWKLCAPTEELLVLGEDQQAEQIEHRPKGKQAMAALHSDDGEDSDDDLRSAFSSAMLP